MRNYEKKISELGLDGKLSKNLNKLIKDFKDAEDELPNLEAQIKNAESEEKSEELQKEFDGLVEALNESDEELCHKIDIFFKNRDKYAELTKKMRDSRDAKLIAEGKPPIAYKNSTPQPTQVAPVVAPTPVVVETTTPPEPTTTITKSGGGETQVVTPKVEVVEEKKEEKGLGSLLLWGALGVAGIFIGVNLYKNRN
jgi:Rad3-related DNA helicase